MSRRIPFILRAVLLLMVALGPLQAQIVFACAMMDTVVHDECCCEDHDSAEAWIHSERESALETSTPCCEQSVEVGVDEDGGPDASTAKHAEMRFGADPLPALLASLEGFLPPDPAPVPGTFDRFLATGESGSDTWLITRRLRI